MTQNDLPTGFDPSRVPTFADPIGRRPGVRKQNPFRIVALALDRALGNFAAVICHAASVKARFDHAKLAVYYRDDRAYKSDILRVCPEIDQIVRMGDGESLPLDAMDIGHGAPIPPPNHWYSVGWNSPHLLLTPSMAPIHTLGTFEQTSRFRFTDEAARLCGVRLRDAGVDPDRWFCVIHYREPTYGHRTPQPVRDVDPKSFEEVSRRIIENLGGQVVRVGHPEMTPFSVRPGFVDLAPQGDIDFELQLFAISRARFLLTSNSGPGICGSCFGTPTAMCNNPVTHSVWNSQDAAMWSHIIAPDGRRIAHEVAVEREMYFMPAMKHLISHGYKIVLQSVDELTRLATLMHDRTTDTPKWRDHWHTREAGGRPNMIPISLDPVHRETRVEYPDLAPGTGTLRVT